MNDKETARSIKQCFVDFDEGSKEYLCKSDLKYGFTALLGFAPTKYEVDRIMAYAAEHQKDENVDGVLEETFSLIMAQKLKHLDEDDTLRQMFAAFDVGCRGYLTLQDTMKAFQSVNPSIAPKTVHDCFQYGDSDCDGRIGFQEFCRLMRGAVFT